MPYKATVLPVMIASPGDVNDCRDAIRQVLHDWDYIHSHNKGIVLMPVAWETHSSPELGQRAQDLLNDRLLKECDLLVAVFWTRLGTPTGMSQSGTVEEIQRHITQGKPAMVYFSTAPVAPESLDLDQFAKLKEFKGWCRSHGLVQEFENLEDFRQKFMRQLQITMKDNEYLVKLVSAGAITDNGPNNELTERAGSVHQLSNEAKTLLCEAADSKDGMIINTKTFSGHLIQSNDRTFGDGMSRGSMARWEFALESLVDHGLIKPHGTDGQVFEITKRGYEIADHFKSLV